jgi:hypothetical protein
MRLILLALLLLAQSPTPAQIVTQIKGLLDELVPPVTSTIVQVPAGANLQAAIDAAAPGTTLQLATGATYTGNFILRNKTALGSGIIIIRASTDAMLPPTVRVGPASVLSMATLTAPPGSTPILTAEDGAANYTLIGLELAQPPATPTATLVELGRLDMTALSQVPANITFDRVYVHGDPTAGGHRGLELNVANGTVTNSYLSGFWQTGQDSQAIAIFNGPGPLTITNNYLEATGENFLAGGQDPSLAGLIPSDLTIVGNYFFKPLAWQTTHVGGVKNLFELKNARRAVISGNVFENCWTDGQSGSGVLFTVRNQSGTCPWCTVRDVTLTNNVIRHVTGFAISVLGLDDTPGFVSVQGVNMTVSNNLFLAVNGGVMLASALNPSTFTHNTMLGIGNTFLSMPSAINSGLTFTNSVVAGGLYGIAGNGTMAMGTPSLQQGAPGALMAGLVIDGNVERVIPYPAGNFPLAAGGLAALLDAQDRFLGPQRGADGLVPGANISAILAAIPWVTIP